MRRLRLTIGFACLAGLAGCDQFDPTLPVRDAVGGAAPWSAVTAFLSADSDKAQSRADHREGHERGVGRGGCPPGRPRCFGGR